MTLQELRYSLRSLAGRWRVNLLAAFTLALGIGACTAIFSVVQGVLLAPLPYPEPERLVRLWELSDRGSQMNVPEANFVDWRDGTSGFEAMAGYQSFTAPVIGGAEPTLAQIATVSRGFFDVLGVQAGRGRALVASDSERGAAPVVVVSHDFWRQELGGRTDFESMTLTIMGTDTPVVGVMPAGFSYPDATRIWGALEPTAEFNPSRSAHNWRVVARRRPA